MCSSDLWIVPQRFKAFQEVQGVGCVKLADKIQEVVTFLNAKVHRGKTVERHIACAVFFVLDNKKRVGSARACVGFKGCLAPYPVRTLLGYRLLRHGIAQLYLKFRTVQTFFAVKFGNIEFSFFLGRVLLQKRGGSKNKTQFLNVFKLFFQSLIGIHGKTGRGNAELAPPAKFLAYVVYYLVALIVKHT